MIKGINQKLIDVANLDATIRLGESIGRNLRGGEVIELSSDLGGGKTTINKAVVSGTGSKDLVSSPSFTICNQYSSEKFTIYHFDFYRLNDPGIIRQELVEFLGDPKAVIIIEWPAVVEDSLPEDRLGINLLALSEEGRRVTLSYTDRLDYLLKGIRDADTSN